jgi:peptide deformylase
LLAIHQYPDAILAKRAEEVEEIDGLTNVLLTNMVDTMYNANGIGLAANQVGVHQRAIVVDTDSEDRGKKLVKLINPEVIESSGQIIWEEGCLSVIDYSAEVERAAKILVRGWTPDQKEIEIEAEDLLAVCLQHEIDHLNGTLFIDRISRLKRDMYSKRLKRMAKSGQTSVGDGVPSI